MGEPRYHGPVTRHARNLRGRLARGLPLVLATGALMVACTPSLAPDGAPSASEGRSDASEPGPALVPQSATTEAKPEPAPSRTATVVMSGDLLWHSGLWETAASVGARTGRLPYDFSDLFAGMRPVIEGADLAICHEEVPLSPDDQTPSGYPVFGAPQEVAPAIAETGWDLCTTSSNHSIDRGFAGIETTLREFDEVGLLHTGTFRSPEEREIPAIYTTAGGVRIAVVSGTYSTNGIPLPEGREWSVAMLDAADMIARAEAARAAGADVVLAAVHAGEEYVAEPNAQQIELAEALTASDAIDLVYGHHVHVVQPWAIVNGKWVVYGLGNMIATPPADYRRSHEGVTARFTFVEQPGGGFAVARAQYIPTLMDSYWAGQTPVLRHVTAALGAGDGVASDLETARAVTHDVVFSLGVPEAPAMSEDPGLGAPPATGLEEG